MNNRHGRQVNSGQTTYRKSGYINGNTVRIADPVREMQNQPKKVSHTTRKNRERVLYMNLGYVIFLTGALLVAGIALMGYLQMQAKLTLSIKNVALLESELNDLKLSNDEELERINSSINLEEIKRIAVEELGMTYAKEGQVVKISGEGSDYVRQLKILPSK